MSETTDTTLPAPPVPTTSNSSSSTSSTSSSSTLGSSAESPVTPKKRGRPRKAPAPEGETPPKRRRGRPRKSETEARQAEAAAAAAAAGTTDASATPDASGESGDTPKKKRGRPKKDPNAEGGTPKKRGRPRKVRDENAAEASPSGGGKSTDTPPKKRGRPRKNTSSGGGDSSASEPVTAAPIAPNGGSGETKESDAVHEPRMESRKRRRNASKSPARKADSSAGARKKLKFSKNKGKDASLDFEHLDRHSRQELEKYVGEKKINMKVVNGNTKPDLIHAILYNHFSNFSADELKTNVTKRAIDMAEYGNTNKRKMDYIHALIDHLMGKEAEPLWDLWKEIYLVGTEWENYDSVFDVVWDFDHLKEALAEDGELYKAGEKHAVYLFGVTEPQLVKFEEKDRVVPIPAIVAIISSLPPPSELGIKSVQKVEEEFVPMKELKMDWVPYVPKAKMKYDPKKVVPRAFFLKTHQRREGLKDMKEEELVKFNFALPYIFLPRAQEAPSSDDTVVNVVTEVNGKGATFEFDWEMDDIDELSAAVLKDNGLNPKKDKKELAALVATINDAVKAEKQRVKDEKASWKAKIDGLGPEKKKALNELKIWKYYPQNDYPDVSGNKVPFVNRYYGKADRVL